MPGAYVALTVILLGFAGLFALAASSEWLRLSRRGGSEVRPANPTHALRSAAGTTAVALLLIGAALLWLVFLALDRL